MIAVTRRRPELGLLIWVAAMGITGSVAVAAAEVAGFRPQQLVIPVTFVVIAFVLHLFLAARGMRGDQLLLPIAAALTAIGLVLVQRLASNLLVQRLSWTLIAAGAFAATILIPRDLTALSRFKWTWALLGVLLLMSPLLPIIGRAVNGARISISVGTVSFEPCEAVKILLVIFFAAYLEEFREVLSQTQRRFGPIPVPPLPYFGPIVAMWAIAMVVMVFEKDLGATLLFLGIFLAMLYLATGEAFYTLIGILMLLVGGFFAYQAFGHVAARVDVWLHPFAEEVRFSTGYQLVQGLFALANGGLFGAGLGNGMPERIPVVWSDFVFDAFAEEVGFAGAIALPFVAYGGSSLVTNWMLVALLIRVSDVTARVRGTP